MRKFPRKLPLKLTSLMNLLSIVSLKLITYRSTQQSVVGGTIGQNDVVTSYCTLRVMMPAPPSLTFAADQPVVLLRLNWSLICFYCFCDVNKHWYSCFCGIKLRNIIYYVSGSSNSGSAKILLSCLIL